MWMPVFIVFAVLGIATILKFVASEIILGALNPLQALYPNVFDNVLFDLIRAVDYWFLGVLLFVCLVYIIVNSERPQPGMMGYAVKLKRGLIPLILILSVLNTPAPVVLGYDGYVSAAEIQYNFGVSDQYPVNFTTIYPNMYNTAALEGNTVFDSYDFVGDSGFNYTLRRWKQNLYHGGEYANEFTFYIYEHVARRDGGVLIDSYGTWTEIGSPGDYNETQDLTAFDLTCTGYDKYILGIGTPNTAPGNQYYRTYYSAGNWGGHFKVDTDPTPPTDPLTGEQNFNYYTIPMWINYDGTGTNYTTVNEYYGDQADFIARRDLLWTYPTTLPDGQTVNYNTKSIKIIYPYSESFLNLTSPTGGVPPSMLSFGIYNLTHRYLVIPNAVISTYGETYELYTESGDYQYSFSAPYYENGTQLGSNYLITAYTSLENTIQFNTTVNGTLFGSDDPVIWFSWDLGGGYTRRYYVTYETEEILVTLPESTYALYEFEIKDYTGLIGKYDAFLEAHRMINGTRYLIERMKITDAINNVPLNLVAYRTYLIKVNFDDHTVYSFGFFIPGADPSPTLAIKDIGFSQQTQITHKYIQIESTRSGVNVYTNYNDTLGQTNQVNYTITYLNGTIVYTDTSTSSNIQFNYGALEADRTYRAIIDVNHDYFGDLQEIHRLDGSITYQATPSLTAFGSFGGLNPGDLLGYIMCILVTLTGSGFNMPLALLAGLLTAGYLTRIGIASFSGATITVLITLTIIYAYTRRDQG